jgi:hypothetical protein
MAIVRRIRPENDIARPLSRIALWRYVVVSYCYVILILVAHDHALLACPGANR